MASSLSRALYRNFLQTSKPSKFYSFCSKSLSSSGSSSDSDILSEPELPISEPESETEPVSFASSPSDTTDKMRSLVNRPLEDGLDVGVYKAILVGQVGQNPIVKKLRSGNTVTMLVVGTGGIRNNRRPLDNEDPKEYANRCAVQYHRVVIYPERLGRLVAKNMVPGSILYLEGNLETKVFSDQITGLVRRVREIAIRRNGRLVFLGKTSGDLGASEKDMRRAGYF